MERVVSELPEIVVTDHDTCAEVLTNGECYDDAEDAIITGPFDNVISIVGTWSADPEDTDPPGGWDVWEALDARKLRLVFDDVLEDTAHGDAPNATDVQEIIDFADGIGTGRTIIHCAAGISRSTAAALIVIAKLLGPYREDAAIDHLCDIKGNLRPHAGMVEMADELLGLEGRLFTAYVAVWGAP